MAVKKSKRKKGCLILLTLSLLLIASGWITVVILKSRNDKVKEYFDLPKEVRHKGIRLEAARIWHFVHKPKISSEDVAGITKEKVYHSVLAGANWLLKMQESSGRFNYWYNPEADVFSDRWDDNFLRQAGTAFSLSTVYQISEDTSYLNASKNNLDYLFRFLKSYKNDKLYFLFNSKAKLGGIALPMLAMLKIKELTATLEYDLKLQRLANMLIYLQDFEEEGKFKSTYIYDGAYDYEQKYDWESMIYPGEAMFALEEMYRIFKLEKYKVAFDKALNYYDWKRYNRNLSYIPWTTSALSYMAIETGDQDYLDYAVRLSKYTLFWQNPNPRDTVFGSFFGLPNVFSAVYLEGIGDCIRALTHFDKNELAADFKLRARAGFQWLIFLQIDSNEAEIMKSPEQALGGFPTSTYQPLIRIDNTQHAISALSKGYLNVFK